MGHPVHHPLERRKTVQGDDLVVGPQSRPRLRVDPPAHHDRLSAKDCGRCGIDVTEHHHHRSLDLAGHTKISAHHHHLIANLTVDAGVPLHHHHLGDALIRPHIGVLPQAHDLMPERFRHSIGDRLLTERVQGLKAEQKREHQQDGAHRNIVSGGLQAAR